MAEGIVKKGECLRSECKLLLTAINERVVSGAMEDAGVHIP